MWSPSSLFSSNLFFPTFPQVMSVSETYLCFLWPLCRILWQNDTFFLHLWGISAGLPQFLQVICFQCFLMSTNTRAAESSCCRDNQQKRRLTGWCRDAAESTFGPMRQNDCFYNHCSASILNLKQLPGTMMSHFKKTDSKSIQAAGSKLLSSMELKHFKLLSISVVCLYLCKTSLIFLSSYMKSSKREKKRHKLGFVHTAPYFLSDPNCLGHFPAGILPIQD